MARARRALTSKPNSRAVVAWRSVMGHANTVTTMFAKDVLTADLTKAELIEALQQLPLKRE